MSVSRGLVVGAVAMLAAVALVALGAPATAAASANSIAGTVTDANSAALIEGIEACAYPTEGESEFEEFGEACGRTAADGTYAIPSLSPGAYVVEFWPAGLNYIRQFYKDAASLKAATPVTVGVGVTSGIDAAMRPGGQISGTVTDAGNQQPLAKVEVCAETAGEGESVACALTQPNGEYTLKGLPTGSYAVEFWGAETGYVTQWFEDASDAQSATPVPVSVESTTQHVDAALAKGGTISGTARYAATGGAIPGLLVCAHRAADGSYAGCAITGIGGVYSLAGLPTGTYKVGFSEEVEPGFEDGFLTQFYDEQPTLAAATPIPLAAPGSAAGIDAQLLKPGEAKPALPVLTLPVPIVGTAKPAGRNPLGRRCRRGFKKRLIRGKPRCVRARKHHARRPGGRRPR